MLSILAKISARSRPSCVIGLCALAILLLGQPEPVLAQCAFVGSPFTLNCSPGGNFYPAGINLPGGSADQLLLMLEPGVEVVLDPGANLGNAVNAANSTGPSASFADVTLIANNGKVTNVGNPAGANNTGLRIQSAGSATITGSGAIAVDGTASDWAILDIVQNGAPGTSGTAMVTYGSLGAPGAGLSVGNATLPGGLESGGIQADTRGTGDAIINASGNITGFAGAGNSGFYGLIAHSGDTESTPGGPFTGNAQIFYHSGTIDLTADGPRGILAWSQGDGSATVTTDPGTKIVVSGPNVGGPGVYLFAGSATAANGRTVTANVASEIMSSGPAIGPASRPYGIRAVSVVDAPISVSYTGLGITTQGMNGVGIGTTSGSGSIDVNSTGPITTNGSSALGVLADSGGGPVVVTTSGQGAITTLGPESHGIFANSSGSSVQVTATDVSTTGEFSAAINATGGDGGVAVNVPSGGSIMGGWQPDVTSVGVTYGLPAAGVILGSSAGAATLTNDGSIGALSDRAIASPLPSSPLFPFTSNNTTIINNGTITGFVQLVGGDNSIVNNGRST